jgi:hypothetical protein
MQAEAGLISTLGANNRRLAMSGNKPFGALAIITALGVLGVASARAGGHEGDRKEKEGYVVPCSLAGVNPVYHPEIFGNPAVAASYGFVRARDGTWQVGAGCGAPAAASAYAPRPESTKSMRQRRR